MTIKMTVTVSGPGKLINQEMEIIARALRAHGIYVTVTNAHPHHDPFPDGYTMDEALTEMRAGKSKSTVRVSLVADHRPWGG